MKALYFGAVYDQLDLPQLAWAELVRRRVQLVELKHKERFLPRRDGGKKGQGRDVFDDAHLYLGLTATRGALDISPGLEAWVGRELNTEYSAMKERRKALEKRRLLGGEAK